MRLYASYIGQMGERGRPFKIDGRMERAARRAGAIERAPNCIAKESITKETSSIVGIHERDLTWFEWPDALT